MTLHPFTCFAVFIAFVVKGLCGFANTLVFSSIMSFSSNNVNISPVDLITGLPANLYMAWRERHGVRARIFVPLALLVLAGCIPGALLLRGGDAGSIKALFRTGALLIPAMALGLGMGMLLARRISEKNVARFVNIMLILMGVTLLAGSLGR